ncbi:MAG: hypothetical protein QOD10_3425, partial [Mycobacterium sp.]|nr:hypothetical protein [Mycobacterium sp.]
MNELTAIVTGASRGFGRAVSAALVTNGAHVVGVARTRVDLDDVRAALGDGFTAVTADAADPGNRGPAHRRIPAARGGAVRGCRPAHGSAAGSDVGDVQRELERQRRTSLPLDSGGAAIAVSARKLRDRILERCSDKGSPLSGGYAGADSTIRFITDYARIESDRAGLGIDFVS